MPADNFEKRIQDLADNDVATLVVKGDSYGDSWKKRGGVGAFMMAARKWDRLELAAKDCEWNIFDAGATDRREEGILDDIKDLRAYLLLIEDHIRGIRETG